MHPNSVTAHNLHIFPKVLTLSITLICGVLCIPHLYKHRKHPVMRYRTFPIYIATLITVYFFVISSVVRSIPNLFRVRTYRIFYIVESIFVAMYYACISSISIRYYTLILTRHIQEKLKNKREYGDDILHKQIHLFKWLSLEWSAIQICVLLLIIISACVVAPPLLPSYSEIEEMMIHENALDTLPNQNYFFMVIGIINLVLHAVGGIIFAIIYKADRADNFFIYEQFLIGSIINASIYGLCIVHETNQTVDIQLMIILEDSLSALYLVLETIIPTVYISYYGYPSIQLNGASSATANSTSKAVNSVLDKYILSRKEPEISVDGRPFGSSNLSQVGLEDIMEDKRSRDKFGEYLGREFEMEIFLFFNVLQFYKEAVSESKSKSLAKEDAKRIIREFIADNAVNKVPLSKDVQTQLIEDFNNLRTVRNPTHVVNMFQPAVDDLKVKLAFHINKFNSNF